MKRQSFINWERVTENTILESGKQYMVAEIMETDVAVLRFAKWYDKNDIVQIPMEQEKSQDEMTAEEKLLQRIFGSYKDYIVPKAGFYILTSDYGIDEKVENGAFEGCTQMLIGLSDDIFFAEEPLVPEGYLTEEQDKKRTIAKSNHLLAIAEERKIHEIQNAMDTDLCVKNTVNYMIKDNDISSKIMKTSPYCGGIYTVSTLDIANKVVESNETINILMSILKKEGGIESLTKTLKEACRSDTVNDYLKRIIDDESPNSSPSIKKYLIICFESFITDNSFYKYRDRFSRKFADAPRVMIGAFAEQSIVTRLLRCCRLRELEAPTVIQENELRILTNAIIAFSYIHKLNDVDDGFEKQFGINKDGSKFNKPSIYGDFENEVEYELEDDNKEELIDKYIIVPSPNYAYKEGKYALWNPKQGVYYRENGQVIVFHEWKNARDKREMINK